MTYDMIVYNGLVVTVNPDFDILKSGMIFIHDGRIAGVEQYDPDTVLPGSRELIDAKGGLIMPGLVNTHTHIPMTLFRGLADDIALDVWLNEYIFPAEAKYINPESVFYSSLLACAEMLLSGTTTCCDGYFLEDEVAKSVDISGIRAVLGHGVIDFPAPGVPNPSDNVKTALAFVHKWQDVSPLITPSIFCHSPYTCSADTLKKAKNAARSRGLLFQIHAAETKNERDQFLYKNKMTSAASMNELGILDENTLLVHGVWFDEHDIDIVAKSGARISHNPESNMKLASGIAPVPDFLKAEIIVGLGTDGCASNNNLDLFQEMDFAAKLHKVNTLDPRTADAKTILKMATIEGAKAIGLGSITGSLEKGKQADIIILNTSSPHLFPMYNPVSHIVYSITGSDVRDVIVRGRTVVRNRKLLTINTDDLFDKIQVFADRICAESL
ncbi:5-methylthioadenosine/S-adenosylhomocysteine deaminase [Desulfonema limicola]|uniref:5-methylthioadenosine/S-adenosylhomocysteine deaminase n=1 Tax=Desulfonema limicola TaxID=45656 RepID=A0A975BDV4_9BACT|nr:amidohydrolase [Desulfonema limicola]QTA83707.1 5-methylthioadenosine/S-adenosylhomocysteine deaminase [Desulfonema limicola]